MVHHYNIGYQRHTWTWDSCWTITMDWLSLIIYPLCQFRLNPRLWFFKGAERSAFNDAFRKISPKSIATQNPIFSPELSGTIIASIATQLMRNIGITIVINSCIPFLWISNAITCCAREVKSWEYKYRLRTGQRGFPDRKSRISPSWAEILIIRYWVNNKTPNNVPFRMSLIG